jgi:hypothetical protein
MSSESVCQVARSWVDVGSFYKRLFLRFMILKASVRNILDMLSYVTGRHEVVTNGVAEYSSILERNTVSLYE